MDNIYQSEVLIFTEELPENINATISEYFSEKDLNKKSNFSISKKEILLEEKDKFPEAAQKFSIIGDCAHWSEEFRHIIRLLRRYTISVLIL